VRRLTQLMRVKALESYRFHANFSDTQKEGSIQQASRFGLIIDGIDRLEQNMRGMRTSMRTALSRRVREFEDFVVRTVRALWPA